MPAYTQAQYGVDGQIQYSEDSHGYAYFLVGSKGGIIRQLSLDVDAEYGTSFRMNNKNNSDNDNNDIDNKHDKNKITITLSSS